MEEVVRHVGLDDAEEASAVRHHHEAEYRNQEVCDTENLKPECGLARHAECAADEDDTEHEVHEVVREVRIEQRTHADKRIRDESEYADEDEDDTEHQSKRFSHTGRLVLRDRSGLTR